MVVEAWAVEAWTVDVDPEVAEWAAHKVVHQERETGTVPTLNVGTTTLDGVRNVIVARHLSQAVMAVS